MCKFRSVLPSAQCLLNIPSTSTSSPIYSTYLPGQLYTLDQQCMYSSGPLSTYKYCSVRFTFKVKN